MSHTRRNLIITLASATCALFTACQSSNTNEVKPMKEETSTETAKETNSNLEYATLAGGCFWCIEAVFGQLEGVESAVSGYTGGHVENPTYEQVCSKNTGHYEVVKVGFDPEVISYEAILDWFWQAHNPTQADGQGGDIGEPYRPAIFVHSDEQRRIAAASKAQWQAKFEQPIATAILNEATFYPAENYHQDYYELNKNRNPYCQVVITPKLKKLDLKY